MDKSEQVTELWAQYEHGVAYQNKINLRTNLPRFVDFFEGRQWPAPTQNTKSLPRPVVNITKMICRSKKAAILSSPVKIVYQSENVSADVTAFNKFAEYIQKEYGQEDLDKRAITDAVVKGPYFYHYYWDAEAVGKDGVVTGALRCEIIDALNIFFANPTELDEQKQEWILIASRESIKSVRAKADKDVEKDAIVPDELRSQYNVKEQDGTEMCTVLTKYFRSDGEVYCTKATKNIVVNQPFCIAPDIVRAKKIIDGQSDEPNSALPDNITQPPQPLYKAKAPLYPIVAGYYEKREGTIYGQGEVETLIPNQKAINFVLAMSLLNIQDTAWGKYIVMPGALRGQVIDNNPGQTLTDYTNTGNGIQRLREPAINSMPLNIVDALVNLTRSAHGASEVMTGEVLGANMSGAAIAQLQSQAAQPIQDLRETFWQVKKKQGRVLAQFFKLYYYATPYTYTPENDDGTAKATGIFRSSDFADVEFDVVVETMSGTRSSSAGDINMLDTLLKVGAIDAKTYVKAYPQDALANKSEILNGIDKSQEEQLVQLQQQNAQQQAQLQQLLAVVQRNGNTVSNAVATIQKYEKLQGDFVNLWNEARIKIQAANDIISQDSERIKETTDDAALFAQKLDAENLL